MALEAAGAKLGVQNEEEEVAKSPEELLAVKENWYGKPLWEKKFKTWQVRTEKSCIAKAGMGGRYCSWCGFACHYNGCPRRIFEEYVPKADIDRPEPSPDFVAEFRATQKKMAKLERRLRKANERIKDLEDEIEKK